MGDCPVIDNFVEEIRLFVVNKLDIKALSRASYTQPAKSVMQGIVGTGDDIAILVGQNNRPYRLMEKWTVTRHRLHHRRLLLCQHLGE